VNRLFLVKAKQNNPALTNIYIFQIGGPSLPEISSWSNREQGVVRNLCLWFIKTQIQPLGESVVVPLKILIQQLCRQMTERADYRAKATDVVVSLISILPKVYNSIFLINSSTGMSYLNTI